ncbi:MAG: hypothetical protein ROZ64_16615 [Burkholderiaceae bacterium]|jgi:hypothetical protein|nr:hypothetical protein [Burkholderiaceae bacterium]
MWVGKAVSDQQLLLFQREVRIRPRAPPIRNRRLRSEQAAAVVLLDGFVKQAQALAVMREAQE